MRLAQILATACLVVACKPSAQTLSKAPLAAPAALPAPAVAPNTMPLALRGVWDFSAESCAQPYSDARITISADKIEFWESGGKVTAVTPDSTGATIADVAMSGEGEEWQGHYTFRFAPDAKAFTLSFGDVSFQRAKCQ